MKQLKIFFYLKKFNKLNLKIYSQYLDSTIFKKYSFKNKRKLYNKFHLKN